MKTDRQIKAERLYQQAVGAYEQGDILKIPIAMAILALQIEKYKQVCTYAALQFNYSGKAKISDKPQNIIADMVGAHPRTVYRHFRWLDDRNWIQKNDKHGWIFIKGIDRIHDIENWYYRRAAVMTKKDLEHPKEFFNGAALASIIKTGKATGTEQLTRRSETSRWPIPLSLIKKVIGVSRKTAFTYRKDAKKAGYIKMIPNLPQVSGITAKDIQTLKQNSVDKVMVNLFGSNESIEVKPDQLRQNKGIIFAQLANLITANVQLRKR